MVESKNAARLAGKYLPDGATNIVNVGNGWQEFDYKGTRYLAKYYGLYGTAIVQLDIKVESE